METLLALFMLIATVWGMVSMTRFGLVHTAGRRHRLKNRVERQRAVGLSEMDKFIQRSDHEMFPDAEHKHLDCYICGPGPLLRGKVPSRYQHPFFKKEMRTSCDSYGSSWQVEVVQGATAETAEMVSSEVVQDGKYTGKHSLMLDIDLPAALVPSSTQGHYHLYIDQQMTWKQYKRVLKAMRDARIIEAGYYAAAQRQGSTMLRPPWVDKFAEGGPTGLPKSTKRWKRNGRGGSRDRP